MTHEEDTERVESEVRKGYSVVGPYLPGAVQVKQEIDDLRSSKGIKDISEDEWTRLEFQIYLNRKLANGWRWVGQITLHGKYFHVFKNSNAKTPDYDEVEESFSIPDEKGEEKYKLDEIK